MTPDQFRIKASEALGGGWITKLAASLRVNRSTIHRILHKDVIPEKYVLALNGIKIGVAKRNR